MSAVTGAVHWAGEHPVTTAVGAFAIGAVVLLMMRGSGGGGGDNGMGAFYAAQSAQSASGNSLAAVQAQSKAAVQIAQLASDRDVALATANGATNVQLAGINKDATVAVAGLNMGRDVTIAGYGRDVALSQELTAQQGQRQQFWLATGQNQVQGQSLPWILETIKAGGPGADDAAALALAQIAGATTYHPAH
jgi:hypothetical protein